LISIDVALAGMKREGKGIREARRVGNYQLLLMNSVMGFTLIGVQFITLDSMNR